ncbi:MAG: hypothetical protein U1F25_14165 [Rubrivivax sp.]
MRSFEAMKPRDEGDIVVFASGDAATAAAAHTGRARATRPALTAPPGRRTPATALALVKVEVVR